MRRTTAHTAMTLLGAASFALLFGACAFPEFEFDPLGPGSVSSTDTTSSSGGMSGVGGMTTTSTGGGMGGSLPTDCTLFTTGQCGAGRKCSIVNPTTGEAGCVDAGTHPPWSRCDQDTDCGESYFCNEAFGTCHPICAGPSDCTDPETVCTPATQAGQVISTLGVCTANCHPAMGDPCDTSEGAVNCIPFQMNNVSRLTCTASGGGMFESPCNSSSDCALGLACISIDMGPFECTPRCAPADFTINNLCPVGAPVCEPTSANVVHNGTTYGACAPI